MSNMPRAYPRQRLQQTEIARSSSGRHPTQAFQYPDEQSYVDWRVKAAPTR